MLRNSPRENFGSKLWLFGLEWEKRNILRHSEEYSSWVTPTGVLQISERRREEGSTVNFFNGVDFEKKIKRL